MIPRVLASTTSHKREPLLPALEVFGRLGLTDVDLNLHHILEEAVPVADVAASCAANGLRLWMVSGGWCDFFHEAPQVDDTFRSVAHQVNICGQLGVSRLRLFSWPPSHLRGASLYQRERGPLLRGSKMTISFFSFFASLPGATGKEYAVARDGRRPVPGG